jgi:hypothetical protein
MTQPVELTIACADCRLPIAGQPLDGRCTRCHLAHGIATYAAERGIATTIVRTRILRARVSATGADGRPAWLDTLTDVRYLAAERAYVPPDRPRTMGLSRVSSTNVPKAWSRNHDACRGHGGTDRPHFGHGYCNACYWRARRSTTAAAPSARMAA